jgi:transposase InsO family protein|tara:strand:+ start:164 stop:493 length:330 start_codon:yes stop_codon:yes gene_type:complete
MSANDVADTLDNALCFTELGRVKVRHKPRLSSNNSPGYLVGELADYLQENGMTHAWGSAYQPRPQSKIERWHQSIKNQILLNNYYLLVSYMNIFSDLSVTKTVSTIMNH